MRTNWPSKVVLKREIVGGAELDLMSQGASGGLRGRLWEHGLWKAGECSGIEPARWRGGQIFNENCQN